MSPQNSVTGEHMWTGGGNDESSTAQVLTNGSTITPGPNYTVRLAPGAAVTGIIIAPGSYPGQELCIINESIAGSSITFAAVGTSNVADGAASPLAGLLARALIWNSVQRLWYREN